MISDLSIKLIETDDDFLDIVPLKQADDIECTKEPCSYDEAFYKLESMLRDKSDIFIARLEGSAVGYCVGVKESEHYRSNGIFVAEEKRRQGIGSEMKEKQIAFAKTLGCEYIYTAVAIDNEASIGLQKKKGFVQNPSTGMHMLKL